MTTAFAAIWWRRLAAVFLMVGIVLWPLRAVAATIPSVIAYDVAIRPTTTTVLGRFDEVRPEAALSRIYEYDAARSSRDEASNQRVAAGEGAVHAYGDGLEVTERREPSCLEVTERREPSEGVIYDAPVTTTAAEAGRLVALDTNAVINLAGLRASGAIAASDSLTVTANVVEELARHGIGAADLAQAGISVAGSPTGAAVAGSQIASVLRGLGGRGALSASADGLNLAEAAGLARMSSLPPISRCFARLVGQVSCQGRVGPASP